MSKNETIFLTVDEWIILMGFTLPFKQIKNVQTGTKKWKPVKKKKKG